jgi:alpha-L-fucosidase
MNKTLLFQLILVVFMCTDCSKTINNQEIDGKWTPDWENLGQHEAPEWFLDAKLGIQYVGAPKDLTDEDYWHWCRAQQRARLLEKQEGYESYIEYSDPPPNPTWIEFPYMWPVEFDDPKKAIDKYVEIGAKYMVSMVGSYMLTTEGLLMTEEEIAEARNRGLKVGIHYNFLRWYGLPSMGDPGYFNWMIPMLKKAIVTSEADFFFSDGGGANSSIIRTPELVSWYYNWADQNDKEVWVNDDLGPDVNEHAATCDVVAWETETLTGVSEHAWLNWDNLRNEWNCFINEHGIHDHTGEVWEWQYKSSDELLHFFIDAVSKGGGWLIQMTNTKKSWETLEPIGKWLKVNGEAIYNTRPYLKAENIENLRGKVRWPFIEIGTKKRIDWWKKWENLKEEVAKGGPIYYNKSKDGKILYAIHWDWPGKSLTIPNVYAKKGSQIMMLGADNELKWEQIDKDIIIQIPEIKPCEYAYSFKIQLEE